jgi:hypothetical protein
MRRHGRAIIVRDTANQEKLKMVDLHIRNLRTASPVYTRSREPIGSFRKMAFGGGKETKIVEGTWARHSVSSIAARIA